jgi:hypothetical protein
MEEIIKQIKIGLDNNLHLLCLNTTLALPDICGAIDRTSGEASGNSYREWYKHYVEPNYSYLSAKECYDFRCRMLHQARTSPKLPKGKKDKWEDIPTYSHIAFAEPSNSSINVRHTSIGDEVGPRIIDVVQFIHAVLKGVELWMSERKGTPTFENNMNKSFKRHPQGIPPLISGVPCIY